MVARYAQRTAYNAMIELRQPLIFDAVARLWDTEEGRAVMAMWPGELPKEK